MSKPANPSVRTVPLPASARAALRRLAGSQANHAFLVFVLLLIPLAMPGVRGTGDCSGVTPDGGGPGIVVHRNDQSFAADFVVPAGCDIETTWNIDNSGQWVHYGQISYTDSTGQRHEQGTITFPGTLDVGTHSFVVSFGGCVTPACANSWTATVEPCSAYVLADESPAIAATDAQPVISAVFADPNQYGCDSPSSPTMTLDGQPLAASLSGLTVTAQPSAPLLPGPHAVTATLTNGDGVVGSASWSFTVAADSVGCVLSLDCTVGYETSPFGASAQSPGSVTIPHEVVGPVSIGPFTQPLPSIASADAQAGGKGVVVTTASSTTIPEIDVQELTGEPVPFTICADASQCTFSTPTATPVLGSDSLDVNVLGQDHDVVLP